MNKPPQRPLTYSDYINDYGIVEALRIPQPPPEGQTDETWPMWFDPRCGRGPDSAGIAWTPGDPWPDDPPRWVHEEVLFIRTHQAFEVWFAVVLHEVGAVVRMAQQIAAVEGRTIDPVRLGERANESAQFALHRFPRLAEAAARFRHEFIRDRVLLIPSPGRHFVPHPALPNVPKDVLRQWGSMLRRAAAALVVCVPFFDVLSTMTPRQFLQFRGRLSPASGFGSTQFREIEILLGLREVATTRLQPRGGTRVAPDGTPMPEPMLYPGGETPADEARLAYACHHRRNDWERLTRRYNAPSIRDVVYHLLSGNVFRWDSVQERERELDAFAVQNIVEALQRMDRPAEPSSPQGSDIDEPFIGSFIDDLGEVMSHRETIVAAMLSSNKESSDSALVDFIDAAMELDSALLRWRDRHIRFVESMIGRRPGTGGTGVNYLRETTDAARAAAFTHAVPCLWQARSLVQLQQQRALT